MHRKMLALTAAAGIAATTTAVHAAPAPADSGRVAETLLSVPLGHDTVLSLDLRAATLSGGKVLRIVAERCAADGSCDEMNVYQSPVSASALNIDANTATATLTTTIAGRHVTLSWRPSSATAPGAAGGGDVEIDEGGNTSADQYDGQDATVTADVDGVACTRNGAVGNGIFADSTTVTGGSSAQDLSALKLPDNAQITCG